MPAMSLAGRRLVLVLGKGGTGRTTVAAALGLAAAARGLEVLVAEVAGQSGLLRLFRRQAGEEAEEALATGVEVPLSPRLHGLSIDPARALEEYLLLQLPFAALARRLAGDHAFAQLAAAAPGLRELVTMGKLWYLAQPGHRRAAEYDVVVADLPATGHGLAMLRSPRTFADIAASGPLHRQVARVAHDLADPARTAALVVALPQELPVNEAIALTSALHHERVPTAYAVANAMPPRLVEHDDVAALEALRPDADGAARVAATIARSRAIEDDGRARELERLRRGTQLETLVLPDVDEPTARRGLVPITGALEPAWR
jgi:anion-transporting  ArsA/GET3 family ATPase